MGTLVYRDFRAIHFIRCLAPVPGTSINASGAGFTLSQALAKCESEVIERELECNELRPNNIIPLGIAAHPILAEAHSRAYQEAIETLCVDEIHRDKQMNCCAFIHALGISIGIAKTTHGFFCIIRGTTGGTPFGVSSARPSFFSTLLKAWEEYRNVKFFAPTGKILKKYTRINKLFSDNELKNLPFRLNFNFRYQPQMSTLTAHEAERSGRKIVYFIQ